MSIHVLSENLAKVLLTRLREKNTDSQEFRKTLDQLSLLLAIKSTEYLECYEQDIETPLETMSGTFFEDTTVLVPIMRAGSGMLPGFQTFMPKSLVWHLSMSRNEKTFEPIFKGSTIPEMVDEAAFPLIHTGFILDPILATGGSASLAIQMLKKACITKIIFVGILGAPEGVARLQREHPDVEIILAGLDRELNEHAYILPGLGDAGDRLFPTR
ncbi:uracil phosphoribosyltransferase [Candidatus Uhrbacteria bacterium]|nr:uracil phosphoribosyltransferase [Candidatus Uhrbacteria bacterium]